MRRHDHSSKNSLLEDHSWNYALESFSARVLPLIQHSLSDGGELKVHGDTDTFYRYPDLTAVCEATFVWLERAIEEDLVQELELLRRFDEVRARMREIVQMPDKKEQLFIKVCMHNGGRLSTRKRERFAELDDETIAELEEIVADVMGSVRP